MSESIAAAEELPPRSPRSPPRSPRARANIELFQLHRVVSEELDDSGPSWDFGRMRDPRAELRLPEILKPSSSSSSATARRGGSSSGGGGGSPPLRRSNTIRSVASVLSSVADDVARVGDVEAGLPSPRSPVPTTTTTTTTASPPAKREGGADDDGGEGGWGGHHGDAKEARDEPDSTDDDGPDLVGWDGDDDPEHPYNMAPWRIKVTAALLALLAFLSPLSSAIVAPAVTAIMAEFESSNELLEAFVVSVFVLGLAFGPLVWAPLSEIYGRLWVLHLTNVAFVAFTVACALAPSMGSLIAFRFLAGFFGSCILANGGASLADMMPAERRGVFLSLYVMGPIMGPVIGPVGGGFLANARGWRWVFWLVAIVGGAVALAMLLVCRETYAPLLLRRKLQRLRRETGNPRLRAKQQALDDGARPLDILRHAIVRPMRLLVFSPISTVTALYMVVVYGILNLMISSVSQVFQRSYGWAPAISGLAFLGLGVGSVVGVIFTVRFSEAHVRRRAAARGGGPGGGGGARSPGDRLILLPVGAVIVPAGLFLYGWTAQFHTHWIVPIIGEAVTGVGIMMIFMSTVFYLVDAYTIYAASALACNTFLRSIGGGVLPLAGLTMFTRLGYGWGNSVLAFISLTILPVSLLVRRYEEYLRTHFEIKDL